MTKSKLILLIFALSMTSLICSSTLIGTLQAQGNSSNEKIAFLRNGDVWFMNTDGTDQKPFVSGITNAKGRLSWSPDNKRIAFSRQGKVTIKYPDGGGGHHFTYDSFYGYIDSLASRNDFWMSFTSSLGAQSPDWAKNGSLICYTLDLSGNVVDATGPDYTVGFFNPNTEKYHHLTMPRDTKSLMALMPTISPDGKKVCFLLGELSKSQMNRLGLVITSADKISQTTSELIEMATKITECNSPTWSPDGKYIAYFGDDGLYTVDSDLNNKRLICKPEQGLWVSGIPCWSPDSKKLAFGTSNGSIYTVNFDGTGMNKISGPGSDSNPAWTK
jgi:Tol biopolymer transport system component